MVLLPVVVFFIFLKFEFKLLCDTMAENQDESSDAAWFDQLSACLDFESSLSQMCFERFDRNR